MQARPRKTFEKRYPYRSAPYSPAEHYADNAVEREGESRLTELKGSTGGGVLLRGKRAGTEGRMENNEPQSDFELNEEHILELRAEGGEQLVRRAKALIERANRLKRMPEGGALLERLGEFRAFFEDLEQIYETEEDKARVREVIGAFQSVLDWLDPVKRIELILERIMEQVSSTPLDPEALEKARVAFRAMDPDQKDEALYLQRLVLTDDPFGIVVRGHVLIENSLEDCIYSYVPQPVDLFRDLEMFFAQKLLLARMIGVISDSEYNILKAFNKLRNDVAHNARKGSRKAVAFHVTPDREKTLWQEFVSNPAMKGKWPEYDKSKYPIHLCYIVTHLYFILNARAETLKTRQLKAVVDELGGSEMDQAVRAFAAPLVVNLLAKMGDDEPADG